MRVKRLLQISLLAVCACLLPSVSASAWTNSNYTSAGTGSRHYLQYGEWCAARSYVQVVTEDTRTVYCGPIEDGSTFNSWYESESQGNPFSTYHGSLEGKSWFVITKKDKTEKDYYKETTKQCHHEYETKDGKTVCTSDEPKNADGSYKYSHDHRDSNGNVEKDKELDYTEYSGYKTYELRYRYLRRCVWAFNQGKYTPEGGVHTDQIDVSITRCGCPATVSCDKWLTCNDSGSNDVRISGQYTSFPSGSIDSAKRTCAGHNFGVRRTTGISHGTCGHYHEVKCSICSAYSWCSTYHQQVKVYDSYPTCVDNGYWHWECVSCHKSSAQEIWAYALGHDRQKHWTVTRATCLTPEYVVHECNRVVTGYYPANEYRYIEFDSSDNQIDVHGPNSGTIGGLITNGGQYYSWTCTYDVSGHYDGPHAEGEALKHTYGGWDHWVSTYKWWDNYNLSGPSPNYDTAVKEDVGWNRKTWELNASVTWQDQFALLGTYTTEYARDCSRIGTLCGTSSCDDHFKAYASTGAYVYEDYSNNIDSGPYYGNGNASTGTKVWAVGCTASCGSKCMNVNFTYHSVPDSPPEPDENPNWSTGTLSYTTLSSPPAGYPASITRSFDTKFQSYHEGIIIRPKYVTITYDANYTSTRSDERKGTWKNDHKYSWDESVVLWDWNSQTHKNVGDSWESADAWQRAHWADKNTPVSWSVAITPFNRHGYIQIGWDPNPNATTPKYKMGQTFATVQLMAEAKALMDNQRNWKVDATGNGKGEVYTTDSTEVTLYAIWKPIEYDVYYVPDADTDSKLQHFDVKKVTPQQTAWPGTAPTGTHHIFDTAKNLSASPYKYKDDAYIWKSWYGRYDCDDGTKYTHYDENKGAMSVINISDWLWDRYTFPSHWESSKYILWRHANQGGIPNWDEYKMDVSIPEGAKMGSTVPNGEQDYDVELNYDDNVKLAKASGIQSTIDDRDYSKDPELPMLTRTGYDYVGWAAPRNEQPPIYYGVSSADRVTKAYEITDEVWGLTPTNGEDVHLYLIWEPIEYRVAFHGVPCTHVEKRKYLYDGKYGKHEPSDVGRKLPDDSWKPGVKDGIQERANKFDKYYTLDYPNKARTDLPYGDGTETWVVGGARIWARGYRFVEWCYDTVPYDKALPSKYANTKHQTMPAGERYANLWCVPGTTTFRAIWEPIKYTLVYDSNDEIAWTADGQKIVGVTTDTMARIHAGTPIVQDKQHADKVYTFDDDFNAWDQSTMTKDGYTLIGWTFHKDSMTVEVAFNEGLNRLTYYGDDMTSEEVIPPEDNIVTLYAIWVDHNYTINYDEGYNVDGTWVHSRMTWGGRSGSLYDYLLKPDGTTPDSEHIFDVDEPLTPNGFSAKGYTWVDWMFNGKDADKQEGLSENDLYWTHRRAGNNFPDNDVVRSFRNVNGEPNAATVDPDTTATLHSEWKVHEYDLILWYHGSTDKDPIGSTPVSNKGPADGAKTRLKYYEWFTLPTPTRDGWDFIGWWTKKQEHIESQTDTNTWWSLDTKTLGDGSDYREEFTGRERFGPGEKIRAMQHIDVSQEGYADIVLHAVWVRHVYKVHYLPGVGDKYWSNGEGSLSYTERHREATSDDDFWADLFRASVGGKNSPTSYMSDDTPRYFDQKILYGNKSYIIRVNEYSAIGYTWIDFDSVTYYNNPAMKHWKNPDVYDNLTDIPKRYTDAGEKYAEVDMISEWRVHTYNVHYDPNVEMGTTVVSNIPEDVTGLKYHQWFDLADGLTRDGYDFIGWTRDPSVKNTHWTVADDANHYWRKFKPTPVANNLRQDGVRDYRYDFVNRIDFDAAEKVRALTPNDKETVTLYAVWRPHTYTINYWNTIDNVAGGEPLLKHNFVAGTGKVTYQGRGTVETGKNGTFEANISYPGEPYTPYKSDMFNPYTGGTCISTEHIFDVWDYLRENTNDVYKKSADNNVTNNGFIWLGWEGVKNYKDTSLKAFENKEYIRNLTDQDNGVVNLTAAWKPIRYDLYINPQYEKPLEGYDPSHTLDIHIPGGGHPLIQRPEEATNPVPGGYFPPILQIPFNEPIKLPSDKDRFHMQGYNLTALNDHHEPSTTPKHTYSVWLDHSIKDTPTVNTKSTSEPDFWTFRFADSSCPGTVPGHVPGSTVVGLTYQDKDVIVLEAEWTPITYTITYHPNLPDPDPNPGRVPTTWPSVYPYENDPDKDPDSWRDPDPKNYDEKYEPKEPDVPKDRNNDPYEDLVPGYHIDYWTTEPDGGGRKFTVHDFEEPENVDIEEYISNMTTIDKANIHLYAHWAPNTYFVVLHDNFEGVDKTYTQIMTYDKSWTLPTEEDLKKLPAQSNKNSFNAFVAKGYETRYGIPFNQNYIVNQSSMRIDHSDIRHLFLGYQHDDEAQLCRESYAIPNHAIITSSSALPANAKYAAAYARPYQWRGGVEQDALWNLTTQRFAYVHVNIIWDIAPTITYGGKDSNGMLSSIEEHLLQEDVAQMATGVDGNGNTTISKSDLEQWLLNKCITNDFEWTLRQGSSLKIPQGVYSIPTWEDGQYELKIVSFDPVRIKGEAEDPTRPSNTYYITFTVIDDVGQSDTCQITLYIGQDVNIRVD